MVRRFEPGKVESAEQTLPTSELCRPPNKHIVIIITEAVSTLKATWQVPLIARSFKDRCLNYSKVMAGDLNLILKPTSRVFRAERGVTVKDSGSRLATL